MTSNNTNDQWKTSIHFTTGKLKCILAYYCLCVMYDVILYALRYFMVTGLLFGVILIFEARQEKGMKTAAANNWKTMAK